MKVLRAILIAVLALPTAALLAGAEPVRPAAEPSARLVERNRLAWEASRLAGAGKKAAAKEVLHQLLAIETELFGTESQDRAGAMEFAASIEEGLGDFEAARALLNQAVSLRTKLAGKDDFRTIDARYALARIERLMPLTAEQRQGFREAALLWRKADRANQYQQRERLEVYRQAVDAMKKALGPAHPEVAVVLQRQAYFTAQQSNAGHKDSQAAALYQEALAIRKKALGERHPDVAETLEGLAACDPQRAGTLLGEALVIRKRTQGELHPAFAKTLERLGVELRDRGKEPEEAADLFKQELAIRRKLFGPNDPGCMNPLTYLTDHYRKTQQFAEAERWLRQQVELTRNRLEREPEAFEGRWIMTLGTPPEQAANPRLGWTAAVKRTSYALALQSLAGLYRDMGKYAEAAPLLAESVDYQEEFQQMLGAVVPEAEQQNLSAGLVARSLYDYLSVSLDTRAHVSPDEVYRRVLAWKGGTFVRQRRARVWRERPDLKPLYAELGKVSGRLGAALRAKPVPEDTAAWNEIATLLGRREELESTLVFRIEKLGLEAKRQRPTPARLQAVLPEDTVLIDLVRFFPLHGARPYSANLTAFVVRPHGPIVRHDFGPIQPIEEAVTAWHDGGKHHLAAADASLRLGQMLWEPLLRYVENAQTVLIAPDGELCRFPWATLPGKKRNTYLLEDRALVLVPVPQLLIGRELTVPPAAGCLLIGDIEFGPDPSKGARPPARPGPAPQPAIYFPPLAGTGREINFLSALYRTAYPKESLQTLRGKDATKTTVCQAAAGRRHLHLATHGFFEPESRVAAPGATRLSAQVRFSTPGLQAGIALAGANLPPQRGRDDGILSADEAQQLDLNGTNLVVLSACETMLGSQAEGEGMMGLQRAFQVAGARSLVSSLWPVSDGATSLLMEEFYTNYWEKKRPKHEALREAQLRILRDPEAVIRRIKELRLEMMKRGWNEAQLVARGLGTGMETLRGEPRRDRLRSPAAWWAAFVLSGDWR